MLNTKLYKQITAAIMSCILVAGIDITFASDSIKGKTVSGKSVTENEKKAGKPLRLDSMPVECIDIKIGTFANNSVMTAIMSNGDLYCWGYNGHGRVGNGSKEKYQCTPVKVLSNVKSVIPNDEALSMSALTETGELYCWGYQGHGTVGNGKMGEYCQLTPVKILDNIKYVDAGSIMSAVTETGDLYWWGDSYYNFGLRKRFTPEYVLENVKSVSSYVYNITAITETGDLYSWGNNKFGTIGDGSYDDYSGIPELILQNVKSVLPGKAAITETGDLYCWGYIKPDYDGEDKLEKYERTPTKMLENVKSVICDGRNNRAITETGDLYCWGDNSSGEAGNGSEEKWQYTPAKILENVKCVTEDSWPEAAITETGELYCWGYWAGEVQRTPVKVLDNVKFVDGNWHAATAITETGDLYCMGMNLHGAVGKGAEGFQRTPVKVLENVKSVTSANLNSEEGDGFVMAAITEKGDLYCWGANFHGEAGNGSTKPQLEPLKVLGNVKTVIPGRTMAAITQKGEIYCWGKNDHGEVGNGSLENQLTPVRIFPPGEPEPEATIEPETTEEPEITIEPETTATPEETAPVNDLVGQKFTIGNLEYRVLFSLTGKKTVEFTGGNKNAKNIEIPSSVIIEGSNYKVLSVAGNACKGYTKLQKLTIGANVKIIGRSAFSGCKKLKKIIFKTKGLTAERTGSKAFKGVAKNVVIKAPGSKLAAYKKIVASKR